MSPERHAPRPKDLVLPSDSAEIAGLLADATVGGGTPPRVIPGTGCWVVSSYADVASALADEAGFRPWNGEEPPAGKDRPTPLSFIEERRHLAVRREIVGSFTARRYRPRLNERMRRQAAALTQQVALRPTAELMGTFAERFATEVIAAFVGVPLADTAFLHAGGPGGLPLWTKERLVEAADLRASWARDLDAAIEFRSRLLELIERRRSAPRGDLLSDMAHAMSRPESAITLADLAAMVDFTFEAVDSLASLVCVTALEIAARPDVMAAVVREPRRIGAAVEEALRLGAVERGTYRRTTRAVRLGGAVIPEGTVVLLWLESANRDPRRFDRPGEFLLDRLDGHRHLAFGRGRHRCLGASLVRRAADHAVRALIGGLGAIRPQGRSPLRYFPALLEHTVAAATIERIAS